MFGPESRIESKLLHFQRQVSKTTTRSLSERFSWQSLPSPPQESAVPFPISKLARRRFSFYGNWMGTYLFPPKRYAHVWLGQEDSAQLFPSLFGSLKAALPSVDNISLPFNNPIQTHDSDYYPYASCCDVAKRLYKSNPRVPAPLR